MPDASATRKSPIVPLVVAAVALVAVVLTLVTSRGEGSDGPTAAESGTGAAGAQAEGHALDDAWAQLVRARRATRWRSAMWMHRS